jgi:hypothetical protein
MAYVHDTPAPFGAQRTLAMEAWLRRDVGPLVRAQWAMNAVVLAGAMRSPLNTRPRAAGIQHATNISS